MRMNKFKKEIINFLETIWATSPKWGIWTTSILDPYRKHAEQISIRHCHAPPHIFFLHISRSLSLSLRSKKPSHLSPISSPQPSLPINSPTTTTNPWFVFSIFFFYHSIRTHRLQFPQILPFFFFNLNYLVYTIELVLSNSSPISALFVDYSTIRAGFFMIWSLHFSCIFFFFCESHFIFRSDLVVDFIFWIGLFSN